jgi:hypothetical protein
MKTALPFVQLMPALLLILLLSGCVGVMPVPKSSRETATGRIISPQEVSFIVAGQTTRTELTNHLGCEFRDAPCAPALAYSWERPATRWVWWIFFLSAGGGGCYENSWHAFFVKFDAEGRVTKTTLASLSENQSLDEQLEAWAAPEQCGRPAGGAHVLDPDTGVPRVFEWMQQNGQFNAAPIGL